MEGGKNMLAALGTIGVVAIEAAPFVALGILFWGLCSR